MQLYEVASACVGGQGKSLPPLASAVAEHLGPTGSVRLGRCSHDWRPLVPTSLRGEMRLRWVQEHWLRCPPQAELFAGYGGATSSAGAWPADAQSLVVLADETWVVVMQAPELLARVDAYGLTPLHIVCRRRCAVLCDLLLSLRAAPNTPSPADGRTPLHYAAAAGDERCTRLLLRARADPEVQDQLRRVPLQLATRVGANEVQEALLERMEADKTPSCTNQECAVS
eukprot:gnl/TRDRNA2_/TRDRNA2_54373_c0_seq1.p1 gnl/TRDRNA2_/TRDRNA2_54373_c0~~gnl/TRDRNA2_/TRDRNA2_54373_c0_seq1.p1  ORF type:complete len:227 (-),score=26.04 gnl/TRDRNA2_/TRDRNA2_54373_c0_seq1:52-732(-)